MDAGPADHVGTYAAVSQEAEASAPLDTRAAASLGQVASEASLAPEGRTVTGPAACWRGPRGGVAHHARLPVLLVGLAAVAVWIRWRPPGLALSPPGVLRGGEGLLKESELWQNQLHFQVIAEGPCEGVGMVSISSRRVCSAAAVVLGLADATETPTEVAGCYVLEDDRGATVWFSPGPHGLGGGAKQAAGRLLSPVCEAQGTDASSSAAAPTDAEGEHRAARRSAASSLNRTARARASGPQATTTTLPSTSEPLDFGTASAATSSNSSAHTLPAPAKRPVALACLKSQPDGCAAAQTVEECSVSRDGRPTDPWSEASTNGQPCVWCGGGPCVRGGQALCEAYGYVAKSASVDPALAAAEFSVAACPEPESVKAPSLFCFALMLPFGYEPQLLQAQLAKGVGLFACADYLVFSNVTYDLSSDSSRRVLTLPIHGDLEVEYGGKWYTALNTDIFVRVWDAVSMVGRYQQNDWTVKVDPDSVFFPDRLQQLLTLEPMVDMSQWGTNHSMGAACGKCRDPSRENMSCPEHIQRLQREGRTCGDARRLAAREPPVDCGCDCGDLACNVSSASMYLNNCEFQLHGPIEVLSRNAVATYIAGLRKCEDIRRQPFGEDKYLRRCLNRLGVRKEDQFALLDELACGQHPVVCTSAHVSFHPFKDIEAYFQCWNQAESYGQWP